MRKEVSMFYLTVGFIGALLLGISLGYLLLKKDSLQWARDKYAFYVTTSDVSITLPVGSFNLQVSRNDRESAWAIYNQINTRIAAIDFNTDYDSFFYVNKSLYTLFGVVRDELAKLSVERIRRDKQDEMIKFYHSILNDGIRPYLSKWHIPITQFIENEKANDKTQSILEIEKKFKKRKEIIEDIKLLNSRMKNYSTELLKIVKNGH